MTATDTPATFSATVTKAEIESYSRPSLYLTGEITVTKGERSQVTGWFSRVYFGNKEGAVYIGDYCEISWIGGNPATVENRSAEGYGETSLLKEITTFPDCLAHEIKLAMVSLLMPSLSA